LRCPWRKGRKGKGRGLGGGKRRGPMYVFISFTTGGGGGGEKNFPRGGRGKKGERILNNLYTFLKQGKIDDPHNNHFFINIYLSD